MKIKLIPKCQNNDGNAFGINLNRAAEAMRRHANSAQGHAENLNSTNARNQEKSDAIMGTFGGKGVDTSIKIPKNLSEKDHNTVYDSEKAYKAATEDSENYYQSTFYKNRLARVGVNSNNASILADRVSNMHHGYLTENAAKEIYQNTNAAKAGMNGTLGAVQITKTNTLSNGTKVTPGIYMSLGSTAVDRYGQWAHEESHWADKGLTPDAQKWNHSLIEGNLRPGVNSYYGSDTEIRARAMPIMLHYHNNQNKYKNFADFINQNLDNKSIRELRKTFKDDKSFINYMQNFVQNDYKPENNQYELTEESPLYTKSGGVLKYFK